MFANPIARTLAVFGIHPKSHDEGEIRLRAVFADANGEAPTPLAPPPARIPPHQRHLYVRPDDALRSYSMGSYRPAATLTATAEAGPEEKPARTHRRAKASPEHA
jgi:hypothetical protein